MYKTFCGDNRDVLKETRRAHSPVLEAGVSERKIDIVGNV